MSTGGPPNPFKPSDLSIQTADWQDKASPIFSEKKTCEKKRTTEFKQKQNQLSNLNYVWIQELPYK